MFVSLLFAVAMVGDDPSDIVPPPPPPAVVVTVTSSTTLELLAAPPAPVPCDQVLADGSVYCGEPGGGPRPNENPPGVQTEADAIDVPNEAGYSIQTGPAELGPQDPDYLAWLAEQYCAVKPWMCEG